MYIHSYFSDSRVSVFHHPPPRAKKAEAASGSARARTATGIGDPRDPRTGPEDARRNQNLSEKERCQSTEKAKKSLAENAPSAEKRARAPAMNVCICDLDGWMT